MTDVFINYTREDRETADAIQSALKRAGVKTWRDQFDIPPGADFVSTIQDAIGDARCLMTLWTPRSLASNWVHAEAELGLRQNKLFPVAIDVDPQNLPRRFGMVQTQFLSSQEAKQKDSLARLADNVQQFVASKARQDRTQPAPPLDAASVGSTSAGADNAAEAAAKGKKAFISYASEVEDTAIELVEHLEGSDCPCWISFRDVDPGDDYRAAIVKAMSEVRFLVVLYSQHANQSFDVANELLLARKRNKRRFVLKLDATEPDGPVEYELGSVQWIDCREDRKAAAFEQIARRARLL